MNDELDFGSAEMPGTPAQNFNGNSEGGERSFADEIFSKKVLTRMRTFYFDLKESRNGKFVKMSEKSRGGQRSTVMFDAEDIDAIIETLQEIKGQL